MRKPLGKKLRFEVFKRDSFTCQYCGGKAPDIVLHVDHIEPVAEGGTNDIVNLVTSCESCNLGKGARRLSNSDSVEKKHAQLEMLQKKREQLEMMVDWQKGLMNLDRDQVDMLESFWSDICKIGWNEYGRAEAGKWLKRFPFDDIVGAIREATDSKLRFDGDEIVRESVSEAFHLVPKIIHVKKQAESEPYLRDALYIRGILRRRFPDDVIDWEAKNLLLEVLSLTGDVEQEKSIAKKETSYWSWERSVRRAISDLQDDGEGRE